MEGTTKYFACSSSEQAGHTEDMCDRCLKEVGKKNLKPLTFLYMNKNDKFHPDMSPIMQEKTGKYFEPGYRLYSCCKDCWE